MNRQIQSNKQDGIRQLGKSKMSAYTIQQSKSPSGLKRYNQSKIGLPQQQPIYKKIWFWVIVGVLVIAGIGVGIFFLVSHIKNSSTVPSTYQPLDAQNVKSVGDLIISKQQPASAKQDSNQQNITLTSTSARTKSLNLATKSNQQNKSTVNQNTNQPQDTQIKMNMTQNPITSPEKQNKFGNITSTIQQKPKTKVSKISEQNSTTVNQSVINSAQKILDKLSKQNKVFYQISEQIVIKPKQQKTHLRNSRGQNHKLLYN